VPSTHPNSVSDGQARWQPKPPEAQYVLTLILSLRQVWENSRWPRHLAINNEHDSTVGHHQGSSHHRDLGSTLEPPAVSSVDHHRAFQRHTSGQFTPSAVTSGSSHRRQLVSPTTIRQLLVSIRTGEMRSTTAPQGFTNSMGELQPDTQLDQLKRWLIRQRAAVTRFPRQSPGNCLARDPHARSLPRTTNAWDHW